MRILYFDLFSKFVRFSGVSVLLHPPPPSKGQSCKEATSANYTTICISTGDGSKNKAR